MKITIKSTNKEDKDKARLVNELINNQLHKYENVLNSIMELRLYIYQVYPHVDIPDSLFERIMEEVVKMEINRMEVNDSE